MLRSNDLLSKTQIWLLSTGVDCISYAVMNLLKSEEKEAFEPYMHYLEKQKENK
ncbi:hypothetical protein ACE939_08920 [Aquimarina sp. W85]|uniref:hypothetical protein n=1 Tax=Aquimarina rhodophyticola TaxID=3342246 RepID=UPI00366E099A